MVVSVYLCKTDIEDFFLESFRYIFVKSNSKFNLCFLNENEVIWAGQRIKKIELNKRYTLSVSFN